MATEQRFQPTMPLRLKKRADFVAASKGARVHSQAFSLQQRQHAESADPSPRLGLTVTKKVGNSVVRNRVRRRLKEALRCIDLPFLLGHDYVMIARRDAMHAPFTQLQSEFLRALTKLIAKRDITRPDPNPKRIIVS